MTAGDQTTWVIGRHTDCDIQIGDETVSRYHAELVVGRSNKPFLVDRGSTHGTWTNERSGWQRLERGSYVQPDTRVRLGHHETTVRELMSRIPNANRG
jgi:pSer/pThr/pTyr-binding forkhead associated (FHA) protein